MDPALCELYEGDPSDEVSAIIRLNNPEITPSDVRIISRFGDVATVRIARGDIYKIHADENVRSLKAPRSLVSPAFTDDTSLIDTYTNDDYFVQRPDIPETGQGVVIGIIDIGCDFAHPDFIDEFNNTRIKAIWLQKGLTETTNENPYGKGRIILRDEINQALASDDPYEALGYHPAEVAPDGGAHGTHTMGIAAGNGNGSGVSGIAPNAEIVFVQADSGGLGGLANFGDSASILEAVDYIIKQADEAPCVINISMGRHGGPHDGRTLFEIGADAALLSRPGLAIINSTGNYRSARVHSSGQIETGLQKIMTWIVDPADQTPNELEVWYSGEDNFAVSLSSPDNELFGPVELGSKHDIVIENELVGRIYHRKKDPNNGKHHIDCFLFNDSPVGEWKVTLDGIEVHDGKYDAWIERDAARKTNQSRFSAEDAVLTGTTGTIANSKLCISVGAYDNRSSERELAEFSSAGPTVDNRIKPECVAPGVRVVAPSSAPFDSHDAPLLTAKSGTSMSAPHVTGSVALLMEAAGNKLLINEIRDCVLKTVDDIPVTNNERSRLGNGYLNIVNAVEMARRYNTTKNNIYSDKNYNADETSEEETGMNNFINHDDTLDGAYHAMDMIEPSDNFNQYTDSVFADDGRIFDELLTGENDGSLDHGNVLEVVAYPGDTISDGIKDGDVAIERVLGEGNISRSRILTEADSNAFNNQRLGNNVMIVRTKSIDNIAYENDITETPTITFDEPLQVTVPTTPIATQGAAAGEREVDAALNSLRSSINNYWINYYQGLNNFEGGMLFASQQERESRYFEVALKEVAKLVLDEIISNTLERFPVLNAVTTGIKNIAFAWHAEAQRVARAEGEGRIYTYITSIRNAAGSSNGPHRQMLNQVDVTRPTVLQNYRAAVSRTQIPSQGQHGILTGDAALFMRQLREAIESFNTSIPGPDYFTQFFTERFAGSRRWTRLVSHGGRPGGTLYLSMNIYKDSSGVELRGVSSHWELATTAPNPERLASTLQDALHSQNKKIWHTRLPKMVRMRVEVERSGLNSYQTGYARFFNNAGRFEIRTNYGQQLFRTLWKNPGISRRALRVNRLEGTDD